MDRKGGATMMTDDELRAAVALRFGAKWYKSAPGTCRALLMPDSEYIGTTGGLCNDDDMKLPVSCDSDQRLPRFIESHDALAPVLAGFLFSQRQAYTRSLREVMSRGIAPLVIADSELIWAKPRQKCEALVAMKVCSRCGRVSDMEITSRTSVHGLTCSADLMDKIEATDGPVMWIV